MPPLPREARVTWLSIDTNRLGGVEWRGALRAELCLRDILVRALRTPLPSGVAHWVQNRDPAALSVPHFEQRIDFPPGNRRSNLFYHSPSVRDNERSFQLALTLN